MVLDDVVRGVVRVGGGVGGEYGVGGRVLCLGQGRIAGEGWRLLVHGAHRHGYRHVHVVRAVGNACDERVTLIRRIVV